MWEIYNHSSLIFKFDGPIWWVQNSFPVRCRSLEALKGTWYLYIYELLCAHVRGLNRSCATDESIMLVLAAFCLVNFDRALSIFVIESHIGSRLSQGMGWCIDEIPKKVEIISNNKLGRYLDESPLSKWVTLASGSHNLTGPRCQYSLDSRTRRDTRQTGRMEIGNRKIGHVVTETSK